MSAQERLVQAIAAVTGVTPRAGIVSADTARETVDGRAVHAGADARGDIPITVARLGSSYHSTFRPAIRSTSFEVSVHARGTGRLARIEAMVVRLRAGLWASESLRMLSLDESEDVYEEDPELASRALIVEVRGG